MAYSNLMTALADEAYKNEIRIRIARIYIESTGCIDGEKKKVLLKILGRSEEDGRDEIERSA
ncbi:MAG: hypothetical protein IJI74_07340 [Firmicutes bacterium]|nr:hypothetical protein [Bacillota bacterium]